MNEPDVGDAVATALRAEALWLQGQDAAAAAAAEHALSLQPGAAVVQRAVARLRLRQGRTDAAVAAAQAAHASEPDDPDTLLVLTGVLEASGQRQAALGHVERAITLRPDFADAYYARALMRGRSGELKAALADAERSAALQASARNWQLVGSLRLQLRDLTGAKDALRQALGLSPGNVGYLLNLADLEREDGQPAAARQWLMQAKALLAERPQPRLLNLLASAFADLDDRGETLATIVASLTAGETDDARRLFVEAIRRLPDAATDGVLRGFLTRALSEPWGRPSALLAVAGQTVRADLQRALDGWPNSQITDLDGLARSLCDPLLLAMLAGGPIPDPDFEHFFSRVRRALLEHMAAPSPTALSAQALVFFAALAQQCFTTEYVYAVSTAEAEAARALAERLETALGAAEIPSAELILAVAAYSPLGAVPGAEALIAQAVSGPLAAVLRQQVSEPRRERLLRETIPLLTPLDDEISLLVRDQYEANPYPRWVKLHAGETPAPVERVLRQLFPASRIDPIPNARRPDILIAGCGTGQYAIEMALAFEHSRLLAVDLSLSSLAYAARQTEERGMQTIDYGQADLLRLGGLGRTFEVIDCSGVLHHLADPAAGLAAISALAPAGGVMRLGLYSRLARRSLGPARALAAQQGLDGSPGGIRRLRQAIFDAEPGSDLRLPLTSPDFYAMSGCRDLLVHVQEHQFSLPEVQAMLEANGLRLLGLLTAPNVREAYRAAFPHDPAATDLAAWSRFEADHPNTFGGMYQFWVQKNPA